MLSLLGRKRQVLSAPAEDRATQGCDLSADLEACDRQGLSEAGWQRPASFTPPCWEQAQSDKSQGVWGTASPQSARLPGMKKSFNSPIVSPLRSFAIFWPSIEPSAFQPARQQKNSSFLGVVFITSTVSICVPVLRGRRRVGLPDFPAAIMPPIGRQR